MVSSTPWMWTAGDLIAIAFLALVVIHRLGVGKVQRGIVSTTD